MATGSRWPFVDRPTPEVTCRRPGCGDYWSDHQDGGPCQAGAEERECWCPGFRWVDPEPAPDVAGYHRPAAVD